MTVILAYDNVTHTSARGCHAVYVMCSRKYDDDAIRSHFLPHCSSKGSHSQCYLLPVHAVLSGNGGAAVVFVCADLHTVSEFTGS